MNVNNNTIATIASNTSMTEINQLIKQLSNVKDGRIFLTGNKLSVAAKASAEKTNNAACETLKSIEVPKSEFIKIYNAVQEQKKQSAGLKQGQNVNAKNTLPLSTKEQRMSVALPKNLETKLTSLPNTTKDQVTEFNRQVSLMLGLHPIVSENEINLSIENIKPGDKSLIIPDKNNGVEKDDFINENDISIMIESSEFHTPNTPVPTAEEKIRVVAEKALKPKTQGTNTTKNNSVKSQLEPPKLTRKANFEENNEGLEKAIAAMRHKAIFTPSSESMTPKSNNTNVNSENSKLPPTKVKRPNIDGTDDSEELKLSKDSNASKTASKNLDKPGLSTEDKQASKKSKSEEMKSPTTIIAPTNNLDKMQLINKLIIDFELSTQNKTQNVNEFANSLVVLTTENSSLSLQSNVIKNLKQFSAKAKLESTDKHILDVTINNLESFHSSAIQQSSNQFINSIKSLGKTLDKFKSSQISDELFNKSAHLFQKFDLQEGFLKEKPTLGSIIEHFNKTSAWADGCILSGPSAKERTKIISKLLTIADELQIKGDFNTSYAIYAAVNQASIGKMKKTFKGLSKSDISKMDKLKNLFSESDGFKNANTEYTVRLNNKESFIPMFGPIAKKIATLSETVLDEINNDYESLVKIKKNLEELAKENKLKDGQTFENEVKKNIIDNHIAIATIKEIVNKNNPGMNEKDIDDETSILSQIYKKLGENGKISESAKAELKKMGVDHYLDEVIAFIPEIKTAQEEGQKKYQSDPIIAQEYAKAVYLLNNKNVVLKNAFMNAYGNTLKNYADTFIKLPDLGKSEIISQIDSSPELQFLESTIESFVANKNK